MKKILITLPFILLLASCQTSTGSKVSNNDATPENDPAKIVISTYSDGKVTLKDANNELDKLIAKNEKLKGLTFDKLNAEQKETVIKEIVLKEIAYKAAKKKDLDGDKDYQEALRIFETELLKQKLFIALAKEASEEKNVKKNYDELVQKIQGKKDIRIRYIAVKTQAEADALYQSLLKYPNSFAALAKKKSLDKEIAKKGGDLGFVFEDALPAEIVKQVKTMQKGEIAKPLPASGKWVVVKLEEERIAEIASFEKSKNALAQNLAKKAIEDFVTQSLEKAKITLLVK
jgi:peptidyl-prolyl cis-trans isomerase D